MLVSTRISEGSATLDVWNSTLPGFRLIFTIQTDLGAYIWSRVPIANSHAQLAQLHRKLQDASIR